MCSNSNDILYDAASAWKELTDFHYVFTYGYKKQLHTIHLSFPPERFPHLAGFQYLRDVNLPKYNPSKILDMILLGKISYHQITKSNQFTESVKPRLEALIRLKQTLEQDFFLYSYMPRFYSFTTQIQADYLISSILPTVDFIFIIKSSSKNSTSTCDFVCCSAFTQKKRDYRENQRSRTLLRKERIHIPTSTSVILFNRLDS